MATLQDDVDAIAAQTTAVASLSVFVQGLEHQIAALLGLTQAQQSQIDAIFTNVTPNTGAITAAMANNVPPLREPPLARGEMHSRR